MASKKKSLMKIILVGDSGYPFSSLTISRSVGKTSLMQRFVLQKFVTQYKTTIGADFSSKDMTLDDRVITLQVYR